MTKFKLFDYIRINNFFPFCETLNEYTSLQVHKYCPTLNSIKNIILS